MTLHRHTRGEYVESPAKCKVWDQRQASISAVIGTVRKRRLCQYLQEFHGGLVKYVHPFRISNFQDQCHGLSLTDFTRKSWRKRGLCCSENFFGDGRMYIQRKAGLPKKKGRSKWDVVGEPVRAAAWGRAGATAVAPAKPRSGSTRRAKGTYTLRGSGHSTYLYNGNSLSQPAQALDICTAPSTTKQQGGNSPRPSFR